MYANIDENVDSHIKRIQEFLRQPSVASQDMGMRDCAKLLLGYLEKLGFEDLELVETDRHPVVCGRYDAGSPTTLVVHGMYDTGAVANEKDWASPPFSAEIKEFDGLGRCIVAPGALRKSPNATFVNALESILAVEDTLPVNVVFNVEGEHSLMSPNYPQFYEKYKDKVRDADAVFWPMLTQERNGVAMVEYGHKGMMGFTLELTGKSWGRGPQEVALHSADAAIVDNTQWRLMSALVTMTARDGKEITIDGFKESVAPPTKEELDLTDERLSDFDEEAMKKEFKILNFADDLHGRDLLVKHLFDPVLCLGNVGGGSPRPAPYPVSKVEVHVRLVPNMTVKGVLHQVEDHLQKRGYSEIKVRPQYGVPWIRTKSDHPVARATIAAYDEFDCPIEVWPTGTKTPPTGVYPLPYMQGGLGYGKTGVNELTLVDGSGRLAGVAGAEKYFVSFLFNYARLSKTDS
jgi:acetylornithine deacetylase/succinyl-diaminopimelate desuccinylase-like protein